jgi:NitT/TauT family transport system substrate-binding protein
MVLAACHPGGSGAAKDATPAKIEVGYTNTGSLVGLFVAKDQGMFARRGLDVDLVLIALNSTIPSALVGGSIQVGGTTPSVLMQAVDGGLDLVAIGGVAVNDIHKSNAGVVARPGVNIHTAKDFVGKRVGVPGIGAYMHVLFRKWLTDKGVDWHKVNFVEVPLAQASDVLRAGNVDAMLVGEPFISRVLSAKTGYLVSPYFTEMPDGLFSMYFASRRDWAQSHKAQVAAFRDAMAEANAFVVKDPAKSREILGRATHLPPDVLAAMVLSTVKLDVPPSDVDYWSQLLVDQKVIQRRPSASSVLNN